MNSRNPWSRRIGVISVLVTGLVTASPGVAQVDVPDDVFVATFDDPTALAREIDNRVSSVISVCMQEQGFDYVVAPEARFGLEELSAQAVFTPEIERSLGELIAQLVDPSDLAVDPTEAFDPTVLQVDSLIETSELDLAAAVDLADSELVVSARPVDIDLRLRPGEEGYGVAIQAYDSIKPNPQLELVAELDQVELVDYEIALYGRPLTELGDGETGGCAERGVSVLESEIIPALQATDERLAMIEASIVNDPGYLDALDAWRSCMSESGVPEANGLADPGEALMLTVRRFADAGTDVRRLASAREFERSLATVDFECRSRTTDFAVAAVVARVGEAYVVDIDQLFEGVLP